jgi:hypothetical protein
VLPGAASASGGQLGDGPLHDSATSHTPADGRHTPLVANPSAGHAAEVPVQVSATSHTPAAGRHTVVAGANPVATHVGTPPLHDSVPVSHGFPVLQGVFGTHAPQPPSTRQMSLPPQLDPGAALPMSVHTGVPLAQSVAPRRHVPASHDAVSTHVPHVPPALHTSLLPHIVPGGAKPPVTHTTPASPHCSAPVRHGSAGWHAPPAMHATQPPSAMQIWPPPHAMPTGAGPNAEHTGSPVAQ